MDRWTLREATARTGRSVTTLRRYIRSGRLQAEKGAGRYGPEYLLSEQHPAAARLLHDPEERPAPPPSRALAPRPIERLLRETLPIGLYQELQMKHEQLLVQYGMVRAGGLRTLELQGEVEAQRRRVEELQQEAARLEERLSRESAVLRQRLREAELELQGRNLEIAALKEKVTALEMLTRNAVTSETIARQFAEVMEQMRRVDRIAGRHDAEASRERAWPPPERAREPEH